MGFQCERVLLLAADVELTREQLGGVAHVQTAHRIGKSQLQSDARLEVARAKGGERAELLPERFRPGQFREFVRGALAEEQRHLRHALGAADDENASAPGAHFLVGHRERLKAAGAVAMDGHGGNVLGNSRTQRDDARDVRGIGGLRDATEDHFVNERGIESGALEKIRHGDAAQLHRVEPGEVGAGLAERGADSIDDDEARFHAAFSRLCSAVDSMRAFPSPRPSPLGRGRNASRSLADADALLSSNADGGTPSPRGRGLG